MTISSSLNAGVAGLAANASRLATIADNIANSSTNGYKRSVADFHSMVISSGNGTYSAGGVRVTTTRFIDQPGALLSTENPTDLAVRGDGFLPITTAASLSSLTGDTPMYLATTGSFRTNADGYLVTETNLVLMGWPADSDGTVPVYPRDTADGLEPIQINANQFAGEPTENISLGMNLPASETETDGSGDTLELSIEYYDNLGTSESLHIAFTPQIDPVTATNTWDMVITDSALGSVVGEYELEFDDQRGSGGTIAAVSLTGAGGVYNGTEGTFSVNVEGGPISINIGSLGSGNLMTQLSDQFAPTQISKDGSPVGSLVSTEVDANGYVHATFDIGIVRTLYQIPLVALSNPNGLTALDNQTYQTTNESGSFFLWDASDGPTGDILSYALEESAVDVAGELTSLIQTQRAYSSNAKVIQTVDEMLQETTNIKR